MMAKLPYSGKFFGATCNTTVKESDKGNLSLGAVLAIVILAPVRFGFAGEVLLALWAFALQADLPVDTASTCIYGWDALQQTSSHLLHLKYSLYRPFGESSQRA